MDDYSLRAVITPSGLRRYAPCLNSLRELIEPSFGFKSKVRDCGRGAGFFLFFVLIGGEGWMDDCSLGAAITPSGLRRYAPCLNSLRELTEPSFGFESGVRTVGWLVSFFLLFL